MRRLTHEVLGLVGRLYLIALAALVLWTLAPVLLGWTSVVIVSGSMAPAVRAGDVVVSSPAVHQGVRPGQVLLVDDPARPGQLLTHRLVERTSDGLVTKGDANATVDSARVAPGGVRGVARLRVPYVGLPVLWLTQSRELPLAAWSVLTALAVSTAARTSPPLG